MPPYSSELKITEHIGTILANNILGEIDEQKGNFNIKTSFLVYSRIVCVILSLILSL